MKRFALALALLAGVCLPAQATPPAARGKVTAIFISVTLPDGTIQNWSLDPANTEALFFSERAAVDMLGRFYEHLPERKTLGADVLLKHFGTKQGQSLLGGEASLLLSRQSLTTLWSTPNATGVQPAFILKTPGCIPSGYPAPPTLSAGSN